MVLDVRLEAVTPAHPLGTVESLPRGLGDVEEVRGVAAAQGVAIRTRREPLRGIHPDRLEHDEADSVGSLATAEQALRDKALENIKSGRENRLRRLRGDVAGEDSGGLERVALDGRPPRAKTAEASTAPRSRAWSRSTVQSIVARRDRWRSGTSVRSTAR